MKKLRFGVLANTDFVAGWQLEAVKQVLEANCAELVVVVLPDGPIAIGGNSRFGNIFFRLWQKINSRKTVKTKVKLSSLADNISLIYCGVRRKGRFKIEIDVCGLELIRSYKLDFLLRYGFGILSGDILNIPKYGVWSYHHGDDRLFRGRPSCFWEMYHGEYEIGGVLQCLNESLDGGRILKRWSVKNNRTSWRKNYEELTFSGTGLVKQVCLDILSSESLEGKASTNSGKLFRNPTNWHMLVFLFRICCCVVAEAFTHKVLSQHWNIGVINKNIKDIYINGLDDNNVKWLSPTSNKKNFVADPFGFKLGEKSYVVFEDFVHLLGKGCIKLCEINDYGKSERYKKLLGGGTHYSYPFVIQHGDKTYICPESKEEMTVDLYEICSDKIELVLSKRILNGIALADPTIFTFNGLWWLFGVIDGYKLHAWYADDLLKEWRPHTNNPIKINASNSRPAGAPITIDNELYRPSQNCTVSYGGSVVINKITKLNPYEFEEEYFREIKPFSNMYSAGLHTLSPMGEATLIDSKSHVMIWRVLLRKILRVIGLHYGS